MPVVRRRLCQWSAGGFARHLPRNSACVPLHFHDGLPGRNALFNGLFCRRAFSVSLLIRHIGSTRQVFDG